LKNARGERALKTSIKYTQSYQPKQALFNNNLTFDLQTLRPSTLGHRATCAEPVEVSRDADLKTFDLQTLRPSTLGHRATCAEPVEVSRDADLKTFDLKTLRPSTLRPSTLRPSTIL
jgi:hypothetical protein